MSTCMLLSISRAFLSWSLYIKTWPSWEFSYWRLRMLNAAPPLLARPLWAWICLIWILCWSLAPSSSINSHRFMSRSYFSTLKVKLLGLKIYYLFFSMTSRRCLCCCSLIYLSYVAKSRLNLSLSGKKWDDVGSGLFTNALSMYLWYEPILSLSLICSILSLSFCPARSSLVLGSTLLYALLNWAGLYYCCCCIYPYELSYCCCIPRGYYYCCIILRIL